MRKFMAVFFDERQRRQAIFLVLFGLILAFLEALGVGSVVPLVTFVQAPKALEGTRIWALLVRIFGEHDPDTMVMYLGMTVIGIFILKNVLAGVQFRLHFGFTHEFFRRLSSRLLATYMGLPYSFFLNANCAVLSKNVLTETYAVATEIVGPALLLLSEVLVLLAILAVLFVYEPLFSIIAIGIVCAIFGGIYIFSGRVSQRLGQAREFMHNQMTKICYESLSGIKDIKVAGSERFFVGIFDEFAKKRAHGTAVHLTLEQTPRLVIEMVVGGGLVATLLYVRSAGGTTSGLVATLAMYLVAAYRLMPSVNRIIASLLHLRYIEAGFKSFEPILLDAIGKHPMSIRERQPLAFQTHLQLIDARFRYPGAPDYVLDGITLHVKKGEVVGFIGPSGTGKSTLINIILGLFEVEEGQFQVDGQVVKGDLIRDWQATVAYVPQQVFVLDDSLVKNVALGVPDAEVDAERLNKALEQAQLAEFVKELPEGIDARVGERGARLSGGQIQRIGIARALYRNTSVLVFDEATGALDSETEERIIRSVHEDSIQRTILVIAHRYSSLKTCDRIYRLEDGKVADCLTFSQLEQSGENVSV